MAWKKHCPYCGGALGVKNLDDRERKVCLICGRLIYENPVPAVAVVVFDDCKRVLLVRRGVEPGKGKWSLPGGFIELDETPYETARRELFEETML
ncbi:MAG: NUDIX domain-containing protein, partial [bacterium]